MENQNEKNKSNYASEKSEQKILNNTISSDTIKILSLLKSCPSTASSTFQLDNKNNTNSFNTNNLENNDNLSYEEIKAICFKIFMIYAKPINGQFFLSKRHIFQIMKEMDILNENCLTYTDIEILIQQINKKSDKLNSEEFLDLLAKICCLLDDSFYKDKKASFRKLIQLYIRPYLQKKEKSENLNDIKPEENLNYASYENINLNLNFKDLILNDYILDKNSFDILISIVEGLKIIYQAYFSLNEESLQKDIYKMSKESFNIFIKFLRDFEIIPYLLKQRLAELYWSIIIYTDIDELYKIGHNDENNNFFKSFLNNKKYDLGKIYTFKKFFLLFSHISFYYYNSIKTKTQGQKLLYLIEKLYKSKGYQNMPNIYYKTFTKKYSIIPPISIVEKINNNIIDKKKVYNKNNYKEKINVRDILKDCIELNDENCNLLEGYLEQLKIIFDLYCQIYDRYQYGKMSFSNFQKMLLDGELLLSSNKKLGKSNSQEIIRINKESLLQNDSLLKSNNKYKNTNVYESSDTIRNNSLENKINSNFHSIESTKKRNKKNSPKLKISDLNIIFSKICRNTNLSECQNKNNNKFNFSPLSKSDKSDNINIKANISYKIDFILFLKALSLITLKIYPNEKNDINISMKQFINNEIEDFLSTLNKKSLYHIQNSDINNLFKLVSSDELIIQLMNDISPLIKNYFDFYTENNKQKEKLCNFFLFLQFFKDYELYPLWINISNLHDIFYTQIFKKSKENKNFVNISAKINFSQFLECFTVVGMAINSGDDLDMIDKVLFMIDKMFSDNYGKTIKKIKIVPSFKDDYYYFEKILKEKYPSYYERKYSNCNHRYDNKFYWIFEKNFGSDKFSQTQQIDFGELFNKEKVKFNDVFDELNNTENKIQNYKMNEPINELKEE